MTSRQEERVGIWMHESLVATFKAASVPPLPRRLDGRRYECRSGRHAYHRTFDRALRCDRPIVQVPLRDGEEPLRFEEGVV